MLQHLSYMLSVACENKHEMHEFKVLTLLCLVFFSVMMHNESWDVHTLALECCTFAHSCQLFCPRDWTCTVNKE